MILRGPGNNPQVERGMFSVSVVIPAFNAEGTIASAVRSALGQEQVSEVIVVDDCSTDRTVEAARAGDDGSNKLILVRERVNGGPALARNRGFEVATGNYIALLDADDRFLPGRLKNLFEAAGDDWDMAADNVAFVNQNTDPRAVPVRATRGSARPLSLVEFIEANISQPGRRRAELGFLKPVIRRDFLQRHGLRYDTNLRLGEDFQFYVRGFLAGARFRVSSGCGYIAVERSSSLSGLHRTQDLGALAAADRDLLSGMDGNSPAAAAMLRHHQHIRGRFRYRTFLDLRRRIGVARALAAFIRKPADLAVILVSYVLDKAMARTAGRRTENMTRVRFLMEF